MAALLFGMETPDWTWNSQSSSTQQCSSCVPLDQPLSIECGIQYEMDMDRFPGLQQELDGHKAPQPALQLAHPQQHRKPQDTVKHQQESGLFASLPASSNDWANRLKDIVSADTSHCTSNTCFNDLYELIPESPSTSPVDGDTCCYSDTAMDCEIEAACCIESAARLSQFCDSPVSSQQSNYIMDHYMFGNSTAVRDVAFSMDSCDLYDLRI